LNHRRRRADVTEHLAMNRVHLRGTGDVGQEHACADHVGHREAGLVERTADDLEDGPRLGRHIARVAGSAVGSGVCRA